MLASYVGKKIIQIAKKTAVEFVSGESSVYHYHLLMDTPLMMSDGVPGWA